MRAMHISWMTGAVCRETQYVSYNCVAENVTYLPSGPLAGLSRPDRVEHDCGLEKGEYR